MTAMDFLEFRDHLFPSSGFQSSQFRKLENKLGLKKADRINYGGKDYKLSLNKDEKDSVEKSENEYSLFQLLETWLDKKEAPEFYNKVKSDFDLDIVGLMCIPPNVDNTSPFFVKMKSLSDELNLKDLSMGMSDDYIKALKNSSTYIRVGSKIMGKRF